MTGDQVLRGSVPVGGRPVFYRSVLSAPVAATSLAVSSPVLLLHGLAGSGEVWMRCLDRFSKSLLPHAVFAPDMPGFGCSPGPRRALDMDGLADWSVRLLDTLGVERADLAGHSMGCQVALSLAHRYPERVGRLVLVGPTTGVRTVPLWRYLAGMLVGSSREPLVYRALAVRMFWRMGLARYVATVREMMSDDPVGRAAAVAAPCLVIRGSRDALIPQRATRILAAALPQGSYHSVRNASHVVPFTNADEFTRLALAFWARTERLDRSGLGTRHSIRPAVEGVSG